MMKLHVQRLLKILLIFSLMMVLLSTFPALGCHDAWLISVAVSALFALMETLLPTYVIKKKNVG